MPSEADIVAKIKNIFDREEVKNKTMIVKEGAVCRRIYYIEKGIARAWFDNGEKEVTFQFFFEGQFLSSFESILANTPSWYSVETLEPAILYSISVAELRQKLETLPHVKEFYHQYVQKRLLFYQKLFVAHIKDSPEKRYQELMEQHPEIIHRVAQHYIASYLGITSVSLSRIRNRR